MISDLRTILEDALERIKSEIFGSGPGSAPGSGSGREPSADDTEQEPKQD